MKRLDGIADSMDTEYEQASGVGDGQGIILVALDFEMATHSSILA